MDTLLLHQGASILKTFLVSLFWVVVDLPVALVCCLLHDLGVGVEKLNGECVYYEGMVNHVRRRPKKNSFTYPVRMAVLGLDDPPAWWGQQAGHHWSADEARHFAGTKGPVRLLTHPVSSGYIQNPISVYYCYSPDGNLECCVAEVTNTPWGERVRFIFRPSGEEVPKALHVSPLMDMQNYWILKASAPAENLHLSVNLTHPDHGNYFFATLVAKKCHKIKGRNERSGLLNLLRYGYQPHRVAFWIYWQALRLLWMGVPFFPPPKKDYRSKASMSASHQSSTSGDLFLWSEADRFPWKET